MTTKAKVPVPAPVVPVGKVDECKVDGCEGRIYTRGLCALHWCTRGDLADKVRGSRFVAHREAG